MRDRKDPYYNLDYDIVLLLGGPADGAEMVTKKGIQRIYIPTVRDYVTPDLNLTSYNYLARLTYERRTGTRIFYCTGES